MSTALIQQLKKHQLLSLALIAALSMTACGAKKEIVGQPQGLPPEQTQGPTPVPNPDGSTSTGNTNPADGSLGGGLPSPYNDDQDSPPYPGQGQVGGGSGPAPLPSLPPPSGSYPSPAPEQIAPAPSLGSQPIPDNYVPRDPRSMDSATSKRLTGAVTDEGLFYTSTATDDVLEFLRLRNESVSYDQQQLNLDAAAAVEFVQFNVDKMSEDALVTLKVQENGRSRTYNLAGPMVRNSAATPLRKVRSANGVRTTGDRELSGTLKCLDFDGGCENVFLRLSLDSSPYKAIVNVIVRRSIADLHYDLSKATGNREYSRIRDLFINSTKLIDSSNRIASTRMHSWEVVNGRSAVTVSIRGMNNQLIAFAGPLLAPEVGSGVNIRLSRMGSGSDIQDDLFSGRETKLDYANSIGDARLVANNGLGQVRLSLRMRSSGIGEPEVFFATFMRRIKPIVELSDENLK